MLNEGGVIAALIIAFIGGIISSFGPCSLAMAPLLFSAIETKNIKGSKTALKYSIIFSLGVMLTFTIMGVAVIMLGRIFTGSGKLWNILLSIIMIVAGLQILGVVSFGKNPNVCKVNVTKRDAFGIFILGIIGGILSSPCATPILGAIVSMAAASNNIALSVTMLLLYSLGHSILMVIAGTSVGLLEKIVLSESGQKIGKILKIVFGSIVICIGLYMFYVWI